MKICLVGSTRFADLFHQANVELSRKGHLVYSVAMRTTSSEDENLSKEEKTVLDLVHLRKILESDEVILITDETGYVGESTSRELIWAQICGKRLGLYTTGMNIQAVFIDPQTLASEAGDAIKSRRREQEEDQ